MNRMRQAMVLLLAALAGCVDIEGGAVEMRWDLQYGGATCIVAGEDEARCVAGTRISCELAGVDTVMLVATRVHGGEDPCTADPSRCRFPCGKKIGTTTFFIPDGEHSLSLQALDAAGVPLGPADGVTAPSPVVRHISTGQLTDLNVNLFIVKRCSGC